MTDLYSRLLTAVRARHDEAVKAQQPIGPDAVVMSVWEDGFAKVRAGLEAEIQRHCEADLARLARHIPHVEGPTTPPQLVGLCQCCGKPFPCWYYRIETSAIARVYGIEVTE